MLGARRLLSNSGLKMACAIEEMNTSLASYTHCLRFSFRVFAGCDVTVPFMRTVISSKYSGQAKRQFRKQSGPNVGTGTAFASPRLRNLDSLDIGFDVLFGEQIRSSLGSGVQAAKPKESGKTCDP